MIETDKLAAVQRIIAPQAKSTQEEAQERALRPKRLADYVGQVKIREQLEIFIQAARKRSESLDHVLLFGPPGWARPRWPTSSPPKWASICARPPARCWSAPATSPPS
jgi:hypothetical protein